MNVRTQYLNCNSVSREQLLISIDPFKESIDCMRYKLSDRYLLILDLPHVLVKNVFKSYGVKLLSVFCKFYIVNQNVIVVNILVKCIFDYQTCTCTHIE